MSFVSSLLSPIPRTAVDAPKARDSAPRLHVFVPLPVALTMRAMLLASSVVLAAALAILWLASPASAQTVAGATFPTAAGDVTGGMIVGGGAPAYSGSGSNTMSPDSGTITLNSRRTILDMNGFTLAAEDTLNFVFSAAEDVVLIRVSGYTQIDGTLNVTIGLPNESVTNIGGRVWIVDPEGMVLGAHSAINAGGFLATTAGITDVDFFADVARFSGAPVGSAITVIAPNVSSGGAVVRGDVVYGSAEAYALTFTPGALALHTSTKAPPAAAMCSAPLPR